MKKFIFLIKRVKREANGQTNIRKRKDIFIQTRWRLPVFAKANTFFAKAHSMPAALNP